MLQTIVGKRGTGKTSLAAELIVAGGYKKVFIYDYLGEFRQFAIEGFIHVEQVSTNFETFMRNAWDESHKSFDSLLVLEEIANYGHDNPLIDHVYRLGRHKGLSVIAISQRFYSLPVIVRSQTEMFHLFQITEMRDTQYLRSLVPQSWVDRVMALPKFHYLSLPL